MHSTAAPALRVQVAYALPDRQWLWTLEVPAGCTVEQAIARSPFAEHIPALVLRDKQVGIFSKPCSLNQLLQDGDRIEIYRSLLIDPKEVRRQRARGGASG